MLRDLLPSRVLLPLLCWSLSLASIPASAQDAGKISEILRKAIEAGVKKPPTPAATPPAEEEERVPIFLLRDKSRIPARPAFETISVRTRYGVLKIPRQQLVTVRFARRIDPVIRKKVAALFERLGSLDADLEDSASDSLLDLGEPALGPLRELASNAGKEAPARALNIIARLEKSSKKKNASKNAYTGSEDEIRTDLMTFKGEVLTADFPLKTPYGELIIRAVDLETIRFKADGLTQRLLKVTPGFQPTGTWLDTRMDIGKNKVLTIKSSGKTSIDGWNLVADPDGTNRYSSFKSNQGFPMLSLVGKIGKKGKPFKVGRKYRVRSKTPGRLYLAIQPFDYEPAGVDGHYKSMITITDGP